MDNLIHFAFNVCLAKLYANMFVATLNQRLRTRRRNNISGIDFESDNGLSGKQSKSFNPIRFAPHTSMNVHITTTKEAISDTSPTPMTPVDHLNAFRGPRNGSFVADDLESQKVNIDLQPSSSGSNDGHSEKQTTSMTA